MRIHLVQILRLIAQAMLWPTCRVLKSFPSVPIVIILYQELYEKQCQVRRDRDAANRAGPRRRQHNPIACSVRNRQHDRTHTDIERRTMAGNERSFSDRHQTVLN